VCAGHAAVRKLSRGLGGCRVGCRGSPLLAPRRLKAPALNVNCCGFLALPPYQLWDSGRMASPGFLLSERHSSLLLTSKGRCRLNEMKTANRLAL